MVLSVKWKKKDGGTKNSEVYDTRRQQQEVSKKKKILNYLVKKNK